MKKLIGIFLSCTAFAFSSEMVVMELPSEINSYIEIYDEQGDPTYSWESKEHCIEVERWHFGENDQEHLTPEIYLRDLSTEHEIVEQTDDSLTLIYPEESVVERLIFAGDYCHVMETNCLQWLPYIQSATLASPPEYRYYEGKVWKKPEGDWARQFYYDDEEQGHAESLYDYDAGIFLLLQDAPHLENLLTAADYLAYWKGIFEGQGITVDVVEEGQRECLLHINVSNSSTFIYVVVEEEVFHFVLISGEDKDALLTQVESLEFDSSSSLTRFVS